MADDLDFSNLAKLPDGSLTQAEVRLLLSVVDDLRAVVRTLRTDVADLHRHEGELALKLTVANQLKEAAEAEVRRLRVIEDAARVVNRSHSCDCDACCHLDDTLRDALEAGRG